MEKQLSASMGKTLSQPSQGLTRWLGTGSTGIGSLVRTNISRKEPKRSISSLLTEIPFRFTYHLARGLEYLVHRKRAPYRSMCSFIISFRKKRPGTVLYKKQIQEDVFFTGFPLPAQPATVLPAMLSGRDCALGIMVSHCFIKYHLDSSIQYSRRI